MKVRSIILTIAAIALLAAPTTALAQGGPGGGGWGGNRGFDGGSRDAGHGMLWMLEGRLDRIAERLDLDENQVAAIEAILEKDLPAIEDLVDQARMAGQDWRESHSMGDFDEEIFRNHFETQAEFEVKIKVASAKTFAEVWEVLTPEQQDELQTMRGGFGTGYKRGGGRRVK